VTEPRGAPVGGTLVDPTLLDALRGIQERAAQVSSRLRATRDQLPEETEGWDRIRAASVQIDRLAVPVGIRIADDWATRTSPSALGGAVVEAAAAALRVHSERFAGALAAPATQSYPAGPTPPIADPATDPVPVPAATPRPLDVLAEELFGELRSARELAADLPVPPRGVGRAAQGAVIVELGPAGLVGCTIDPDWVAQRTGVAVSLALGEALGRAVDDLADVTSRSRQAVTARRLDGLLAEAMAHLADLAGPA